MATQARFEVAEPEALPAFSVYEEAAERRDLALTDLRRAALRLLWSSRKSLGAYDVARELGDRGSSAYAVSAYRTLAALVDAHLVVHLVSWRRYAISPDPLVGTWAAILCNHCNRYILNPAKEMSDRLGTLVRAKGFVVAKQWLECLGCCDLCSQSEGR